MSECTWNIGIYRTRVPIECCRVICDGSEGGLKSTQRAFITTVLTESDMTERQSGVRTVSVWLEERPSIGRNHTHTHTYLIYAFQRNFVLPRYAIYSHFHAGWNCSDTEPKKLTALHATAKRRSPLWLAVPHVKRLQASHAARMQPLQRQPHLYKKPEGFL